MNLRVLLGHWQPVLQPKKAEKTQKKKNPEPRKREINLLGPEGNAFNLLGYADSFGKQLDLDVDKILEDMKSSISELKIKMQEEI